jgi:hypothetical protein
MRKGRVVREKERVGAAPRRQIILQFTGHPGVGRLAHVCRGTWTEVPSHPWHSSGINAVLTRGRIHDFLRSWRPVFWPCEGWASQVVASQIVGCFTAY